MKAIVMAGGEGSRLRPLTCGRPKPMVPMIGKPMMEHIIDLLKKHRLTDIGVTLQYLPEAIREYFAEGDDFGVTMKYFVEEIPLGTAGSVKNAKEFLDETFLVISGDALTDIDLSQAIAFHKERQALVTIVLTTVSSPLEYGVVITDPDGRITQFLEKPSWGEVFSDKVNTGIYIIEPEVLDIIPDGKMFDFSKDVFPRLLADQKPLFGCTVPGYWCDVGNLEQYIQAHLDILTGKINLSLPGKEIAPGVWAAGNANIHPTAKISGPAFIGENTIIKEHAVIGEYAVIGNNCTVAEQASVKRSVIWDLVHIDKKAEIRGAILGTKVLVKPNAQIFEGAVLGDETVIGDRSTVKPGIKIWPRKTIDKQVVVSESIVWANGCSRGLFGKNGISGTVPHELYPEFTAKIGAAYGNILGSDALVAVSTDHYPATGMLKKSLTAGLISTGVKVFDLGKLVTPISRFAVRTLQMKGGIHIKFNPATGQGTINFFDSRGVNMSRNDERKLETLFFREDIRRAETANLREEQYVPGIIDSYKRHILENIDVDEIRDAGLKIVLSYDPLNLRYLLPDLLDELGCQVIKTYVTDESEIAEMVVKQGADLGVILDNNAENLVLFDERGKVIKGDLYQALISLIIFQTEGVSVPLPVTISQVIEALAQKYHGRVVRTKTALPVWQNDILTNTANQDLVNYEQFLLHFDGIAVLVKILEYLVGQKDRLSALIEEIPDIYTSRKSVYCPWEAKGKVMRNLIEGGTGLELIDGVKINHHGKGWALVLPDADEPECRVFSEGYSQEIAESLTEMYLNKITSIVTPVQ